MLQKVAGEYGEYWSLVAAEEELGSEIRMLKPVPTALAMSLPKKWMQWITARSQAPGPIFAAKGGGFSFPVSEGKSLTQRRG